MSEIQKLQKYIYYGYAEKVGLDPDAKYLHGTSLRPVVPLDTGMGNLFILGAYPSARFEMIKRDGHPTVADVPIADNLGPLEGERWFDGSRVRPQLSALELEDLFLSPLGVPRSKCWITNLVKVFLFKKGHVRKYEKLGARAPEGYTRERFYQLGRDSVFWIEKELRAARPSLLITLGAEVAGVLHGVRSRKAQTKLLVPEVFPLKVGNMTVSTIHCAHPGILMRKGPGDYWLDLHRKKFVKAMQKKIETTEIRGGKK